MANKVVPDDKAHHELTHLDRGSSLCPSTLFLNFTFILFNPISTRDENS